MAEQFGEKTFEATQHRRQQAREDGQVARSQDLASAILLLAAMLVLMYTGRETFECFGVYMSGQLGQKPNLSADEHLAAVRWMELVQGLTKTLLPMLASLFFVAIAANLGQIGFLFLPNKLALNLEHLSPLKGFQRMFSLNSAVRLGFGIFKVIVVTAVGAWNVWSHWPQILGASQLEVPQLAAFIGDIIFWTVVRIGIALLVLAIMDYTYQRWKYEDDLKMTAQEMREEMRNLQGDPQIAARRRQVARQLAMSRMGQSVPGADVVVTNPTELAIALKYDYDTMAAPIVVAKGAGMVAQRIRRMALESNIPIVERKELARFLYKNVEINQPIPAEQYAAVAEVLKYVYELKGKKLPASAAA